MTHLELRNKFLDFWKDKGHVIIPSSSLVPENDPTTLFTGSGMQPMMPYLLGEPHPLGTRIADAQKCFRAQDIEEVGDNRHTTMFEMLGNWSFGDYFKEEQITWLYEFLTKELGLSPEKLYVSVFAGDKNFPKDEETENIWKKLGIPREHIYPYGPEKNWWSRAGTPDEMPIGEPGGPDSEVFFEFTQVEHDEKKFGKKCHPNCDCGRFLEIGNSVFMTYIKTEKGFVPLKKKNIDFGGGLERILAAANNDPDIFKTDLYTKIVAVIDRMTNKNYRGNEQAFRIIADHIKASVFLVADGVYPTNKMQGYVLRRLLRRSATKLYLLNPNSLDNFNKLIAAVLDTYEDIHYFDKPQGSRYYIDTQVIDSEIRKFRQTLTEGLKEFNKFKSINGKNAFDLFQTFGFPLELTAELAKEKGQEINQEEFKREFQKHQEMSRSASAGMFRGGLADNSEIVTKYHTATHLLQAALRQVLGEHVHQEGSNLTTERLRFDFAFDRKLTEEEKEKITNLINEQIRKDLIQKREILSYDEALKSGALAFFKEKYPEKVSVYSFGEFSKEICGGPHVENTKILGKFKIIKEEAVSTDIRRIYAILE